MTSAEKTHPVPSIPKLEVPISQEVRDQAAKEMADFETLATSYNFERFMDARLVFTRLLIDECRARGPAPRVLDIGCGRGIGRDLTLLREVREAVGEMWGVEPDPNVRPPEDLVDHFQHALMETADLPEGYFDVAYSYMVMEHVADPAAFMKAMMRTLKPGGVYIFATPNAAHYFTLFAGTLKKFRVDEIMLRLLRGKSLVDEYHYPVQYRCNSPRAIERSLAGAHAKADYVFTECAAVRHYLPGPLRPIYWGFRLKRRLIRDPKRLITLIGRVTKAG